MEQKKADQLIETFGKETAIKIVDLMLDEMNLNFNQERIDFYLDVRNLLK